MLKNDRHPVVYAADAGREAPLPFMSALTPIAEVARRRWHFFYVLATEILTRELGHPKSSNTGSQGRRAPAASRDITVSRVLAVNSKFPKRRREVAISLLIGA